MTSLAVVSALISAVLVVGFTPAPGPKLSALVANIKILMAVLWWHSQCR